MKCVREMGCEPLIRRWFAAILQFHDL